MVAELPVTNVPPSITSTTCPAEIAKAFSVALILMLPFASRSTEPTVEAKAVPPGIILTSSSVSADPTLVEALEPVTSKIALAVIEVPVRLLMLMIGQLHLPHKKLRK